MEIKKIGDLILEDKSGIYGLGLSAEPYNGKVRYLRITDIDDSGNILDEDKKSVTTSQEIDYFLKQDDLVVARTGNSTGRTYVYDSSQGPMVYAGFLIKYVFDKTKINPRYLKYFTTTSLYRNQTAKYSGSTRGNMSAQDFKNIKIVFPNRTTQDKMVVLFDFINNKIINNNKINAELESMTKSLYDYWFMQFEFPNEEGKAYKSSGGKMVWNEEIKREIPDGWKIKKIGDILIEEDKSKIQVNGAKDKGNFPFFTSGVSILAYDEYFVDGFNIFLNTGGNPGVRAYNGKCAYSTDTWCISANDYSFVLYYFLLKFLPQFEQLFFAGSGLKHLQKDVFKNKYILLPNNKVLKSFNEYCLSVWKKNTNQLTQNLELASLRDNLLPLLINGQVSFN
jgi:type I restriction enzyme S subunit